VEEVLCNERKTSKGTKSSFNERQHIIRDTGAKDRLKGAFQRAKGKLKEAAGKATGNPKLQAKGVIQRIAGRAQEKLGQAKKVLSD